MMRSNLLPIAQEGVNYFLISFVLFIAFFIFNFDVLSFLAFISTLLIGFIYRNPEREVPLFESGAVVTPVDGKVVAIESLEDDEEYGYKILVESSYSDVSLLRAPISSTITNSSIVRGSRLSSVSDLSTKINERAELVFVANNIQIKVVHTLAQSFDDISIYTTDSADILQGRRYGLMVSGITQIYLPHNFRSNVSIASELKASQTLLGYLS
jgi:phosphatidylserine decarboxylase